MDSFIPWIGGKKLLRKKIVSLFPKDGVSRYIEPFGGAGWVLFYKDQHAPLEVYNDADGRLVNLMRCVKYHTPELIRCMTLLNSRELFLDALARKGMRGQTDIQRAADFLLLLRISYGGDGRSFGCSKKAVGRTMQMVQEIQHRLQRVVIEQKDFSNLIHVYDRPDALFYCDPPYYGTEDYYAASFLPARHKELRDALSRLKGRFLLSYNDHPVIKELYKDFDIIPVTRGNNLSGGQYHELIIKNY